MKIITLLLLISATTAIAAPQNTKTGKPVPTVNFSKITLPPVASSPSPTPAPAPAAPPQPWKLSYFGEYIGPRLSNISLSKTQGPLDPLPSYGNWAHGAKIGYAITPEVVLGSQIRGKSQFDPALPFAWKNLRFYFSWKHMIDTSDVDMQGVVDWELPTSAGSKKAGMVSAINIKNNWTIKTSLRNWSFSALTLIRPMFYNVPTGKGDIYLGIFPSAQLDLAADWSLLLEGSFDASHSYNDTFFDFGQDDPDNINVGVQYSINPHLQINPALKFFTADFSVPILYFALSASL